MENDYPELSGDFALRGAPNSASSSDGSRLGDGDGSSNGNVLHDSQGRQQWVRPGHFLLRSHLPPLGLGIRISTLYPPLFLESFFIYFLQVKVLQGSTKYVCRYSVSRFDHY